MIRESHFLGSTTNVLDGKVWIAVVPTSRIPIYHRLLFKRELRRVWTQRKAHGGLINQSEQGGRQVLRKKTHEGYPPNYVDIQKDRDPFRVGRPDDGSEGDL